MPPCKFYSVVQVVENNLKKFIIKVESLIKVKKLKLNLLSVSLKY